MNSLKNKVAFITGGSRGIGAAIAMRLAQEGANVAFTFVRSEGCAKNLVARIEALGVHARSLRVDSADASELSAAIQKVGDSMGRFDILINNAAIYDLKSVEEFSLQDFDRHIDVNVRSVFAAIKASVPMMQPGGRIVTIGSNIAERVSRPGLSLFAMTKAALIGMTKGAARDLGARGITVNVIQPGSTDTDSNPANGPGAAYQLAARAIPSFNAAEEVAGLVFYLVSAEAKSITGSVLTIDGGANA
ncbi:SDR family oxidoreductase [Pseudomonas aeruginosa]|uniref:SDR family oxidoreductase n=1 Tax=Pseudomonas aeruginosa TaxID=287 RepID=UPI00300CD5D1